MIFNMVGGVASGGFPEFTYTGTYRLIDDGDKNWRIKFLTSGTLNFSKLGNAADGIDVFCVGGGGGGHTCFYDGSFYVRYGASGGGYTSTSKNISVTKDTNYNIVIGAGGAASSNYSANNGGNTSAFGVTANGGKTGYYSGSASSNFNPKGGAGGSGGADYDGYTGGSDGGNGGGTDGGAGQGTTTREFGESTGALYASGGSTGTTAAAGGGTTASSPNGAANSGQGGTSKGSSSKGGSGIVIIRNHRS